MFKKLLRILKLEINCVHIKLILVNLLLLPLPYYLGSYLRARLYRLIGFRIARGVTIWGNIVFDAGGNLYPRLTVGKLTSIAHNCFININESITIGENVVISHHTKIVTDSHLIGPPWRRIGKRIPQPVTIEDGAFICAGATISPGVTVGKGSIVATGAVVTDDVQPNTMVGGIPAVFIKNLPVDEDQSDAVQDQPSKERILI